MVCTHSQRSAVSGYVRRRTGGVGREHDQFLVLPVELGAVVKVNSEHTY